MKVRSLAVAEANARSISRSMALLVYQTENCKARDALEAVAKAHTRTQDTMKAFPPGSLGPAEPNAAGNKQAGR